MCFMGLCNPFCRVQCVLLNENGLSCVGWLNYSARVIELINRPLIKEELKGGGRYCMNICWGH